MTERTGSDLPSLRDSAIKMGVWLLVVIALICITVVVLKRLTGGAPVFLDQRLGRVIGRISLSPRATLYFVRIGDRVLVIGVTPTAMNLISEMTGQEVGGEMEQAGREPPRAGAPFGTHLGQFMSKFSAAQKADEQEDKLEEHLRDIKGQVAKIKALIGGSENEEER